MAANIVLPSLSSWTQSHITALYQATSPTTFNEALDAFLAKDAQITVNGVLISRANFAKQIQSEQFDEQAAIVTFAGTVSVSSDKEQPVDVISLHFHANFE